MYKFVKYDERTGQAVFSTPRGSILEYDLTLDEKFWLSLKGQFFAKCPQCNNFGRIWFGGYECPCGCRFSIREEMVTTIERIKEVLNASIC